MPDRNQSIEIINYEDRFHNEFRLLNLSWLDGFGLTESHDIAVLEDPRKTIIDRGGFLWLAVDGSEVVGSIALVPQSSDVGELAKMSVKPSHRGRGIARQLMDTCLAKARELAMKKIELFSNHKLQTAISLYEKYGFSHVPVENSPFETADIKMELVL